MKEGAIDMGTGGDSVLIMKKHETAIRKAKYAVYNDGIDRVIILLKDGTYTIKMFFSFVKQTYDGVVVGYVKPVVTQGTWFTIKYIAA